MEMKGVGILAYMVPLALIWAVYIGGRAKKKKSAIAVRDEAVAAGLSEPASLHPLIDHTKCLGCGSCISACPEQPGHQVLGLIDGKSHLIGPADCIGHGACRSSCPAEAITLVFGTEKRGVDIPFVSPTFETNVPGIFIAGELGGMGLIRNAIEQGRQAMESVKKMEGIGKGDGFDVVIIGAGPAGFSATLAAMEHKLRSVTVDQETLGGTVFQFPRGKLVMTAPVNLPMVGKVRFKETTKEELLAFWQKVEREAGVKINYSERVDEIARAEAGFVVKTSRASYQTKAVVLAIGRRGTPRKLGVPGEDLTKVTYRLIDAEQYRGAHLLVVGGGDSAMEAAASVAEYSDTTVTLSYRGEAFNRAKEKNRQRIKKAQESGRLKVMLSSNVKEIREKTVVIEQQGAVTEIQNDGVIISAGGILPTDFLKKAGIDVETKYGTA